MAYVKTKKRASFILTSVAAILFIAVVLLGASNIGEFWGEFFWRHLSLSRLFIWMLILGGAGAILGIFLFRKLPYKDRIKITIPIAFIVFSLYQSVLMIDFYFGLSEGCNYFTAKQDLAKGKVQLLTYGFPADDYSEEFVRKRDSLEHHFGYKVVNIGVGSKGMERYNEVVNAYLRKRNGKHWKDEYHKKLDSLTKLYKIDR